MRTILPLTEYEKQLAEQCHDMVYIYLKKHHYDTKEYYDVAIMGLLAGVQQWNRNKEVKDKYSISTICSRNIHGAIATHLRDENRQKRKPPDGFTSLDLQLEDSTESFINSIVTQTLEDEFFAEYDRLEEANRIKDILSQLTDTQRKIVILKASGKTTHYISKKLHISLKAISEELKKLRGEYLTETAIQTPTQRQVESITEYIGVPTDIILALKLSARQLDVVNLLMVGYREVDIGRKLGLSRQAVYDALRKIRKKAEKVR